MKKYNVLTLMLSVIILFSLVACSNEKEKDNESNAKVTVTNKEVAKTETVTVTDTNGNAVTDSNGQAVTEVKAVNESAQKSVSKPATTTAQAVINKATGKTTGKVTTTAKPTTTQAPPPTEKVTTTQAPPTTQQNNPYGYKNAWGSIATMEADCKAYAESIGMTYRMDYTLDSGHWVTPNSSYGAPSPDGFKNKTLEGISFNKGQGYTNIRMIFTTMDNYKDGRCGSYTSNAEMYLNGNTDKIVVYIVVT